MKRLMVIAMLAAPLGCVSNQGDSSLRFLNARSLKFESDACTASSEAAVASGSLDLALGSNYLLAPSVETNNSVQSITINQEEFAGTGLSDITLNELIYSYEASLPGLSLPADEVDRVPIYAVFRPQSDPSASFLFMDAFGPKALEALQTAVTTSTEPVTVLITIKARGKLSGGQTVESNEFSFPVTVFNSGFVGPCPAETVPSGTCRIPGQDEGPITCVKPDGT